MHISYLFFDYILIDLESEIKHRSEKGCFFSEDEIWSITENTLSALSYLYSNGITHNCLRTSYIYVGQNATHKIADPHLFNYPNFYE
jgi:serine/threonine protein kinase